MITQSRCFLAKVADDCQTVLVGSEWERKLVAKRGLFEDCLGRFEKLWNLWGYLVFIGFYDLNNMSMIMTLEIINMTEEN